MIVPQVALPPAAYTDQIFVVNFETNDVSLCPMTPFRIVGLGARDSHTVGEKKRNAHDFFTLEEWSAKTCVLLERLKRLKMLKSYKSLKRTPLQY